MKLFADTPVRRTLQVVADLVFVVWLVLWVWIGMAVHDGTEQLAAPARQTDTAATSMAEQLRDAGGRLGEAPLVGDELAVPFDRAADVLRHRLRALRRQVKQQVARDREAAIVAQADDLAEGALVAEAEPAHRLQAVPVETSTSTTIVMTYGSAWKNCGAIVTPRAWRISGNAESPPNT